MLKVHRSRKGLAGRRGGHPCVEVGVHFEVVAEVHLEVEEVLVIEEEVEVHFAEARGEATALLEVGIEGEMPILREEEAAVGDEDHNQIIWCCGVGTILQWHKSKAFYAHRKTLKAFHVLQF